MPLTNRMGPLGRGTRISRAGSLCAALKRLGWVGFMTMCRGGGDRRQQRHRHRATTLARWRRAARGMPCWGLGVKAGWSWG